MLAELVVASAAEGDGEDEDEPEVDESEKNGEKVHNLKIDKEGLGLGKVALAGPL